MPRSKCITIVGGGLAGLTLGIGLRQRGIQVTIWEAGRYPRHRVCGEFLSGKGQAILDRLGLREPFQAAGAIQVRTAKFLAAKNQSPVRELPPALGLSRYKMDALLAREFQKLGGDLRAGERWRGEPGEGVVCASGRRPLAIDSDWRWFGMKIHARNVSLAADLEMHLSPNGYVGVNRIEEGQVNVCGLFRTRSRVTEKSPREWLRGMPNSPLRERLANAEFDEDSFCSVAGLSLQPQRGSASDELRLGDALTMIPPATGNGMSMALESAAIASEPLSAYCDNKLEWNEARQKIAHRCDAAFAGRLRWARWLQTLMFSGVSQSAWGRGLLRSDWVWANFFARTR